MIDTKHPMPEGSARAETYNPVLDKLEILNEELHKNVKGDVKWEKGTQINRPDETMIKKWLDGVL